MKKKRLKRKAHIMIVYLLRGIFIGIGLCMIFLMVCGVLYLKEHFGRENARQTGSQNISSNYADKLSKLFSGGNGITIVVDAGHGGNDCGTIGEAIYEKDINLEIASYFAEALEEAGFQVITTRSTDEYLSLEERSQIANKAKADYFVSIHCNYYEGSSDISGMEFYYAQDAEDGQALAEALLQYMSDQTDIDVRKTEDEELYVLNHTKMPAVLVECGYMSNWEECMRLMESSYQKELAEALAAGMADYINGNT